jgi:hypothetical protein
MLKDRRLAAERHEGCWAVPRIDQLPKVRVQRTCTWDGASTCQHFGSGTYSRGGWICQEWFGAFLSLATNPHSNQAMGFRRMVHVGKQFFVFNGFGAQACRWLGFSVGEWLGVAGVTAPSHFLPSHHERCVTLKGVLGWVQQYKL